MTRLKIIYKSVFNQKSLDSLKNACRLCVLVSLVGLIGGCSFEKQLPMVCVSDDKIIIRELCRNYGRKAQEGSKKNTLREHGFNQRDAEAIYLYSTGNSASCRVTVARQCDLIVMRNGVGY
jgi:hypothetical protein